MKHQCFFNKTMQRQNLKMLPKNRINKLFTNSLGLIMMLFISTTSLFAQPQDVLVDMCASRAGDDATYLKDFVVELAAAGPGEKPPVQKFSMVLSKDTKYRFSICNSEDSNGEGVIKLFDTSTMIATSHDPAKGIDVNQFDFICNKTGVYHVFFYFKDGKSGSGIGILSFISKL